MARRRASALLLAAALLTAACTTAEDDDKLVVDVFGPYRGDDAANFAATVAPFEEATGIDVSFVGSGSFAHDIQERVADADLPDVAIFPQPALVGEFAREGILVPLPTGLQDASRAALPDMPTWTLRGRDYGIWFRASVKSLVWYPPEVFAQRGYEIPESWEDLVALTERIQSDGTAPWCLTMESFASTGWVGTDWIEDIVLRLQGPDIYDAWVDGEIPFTDEAIVEAFDVFGAIANERGRVLGGAHRILNERWQDAQLPMFETEPECLLHRQASFYETSLPDGVTIGVDTDVFVLPALGGGRPPVVVGGDLAAAFSDRPEAMAFLAYLGTPQAGTEWARAGGFTSPHADFDETSYANDFDRRMGRIIKEARVVRFDGSDMMPPEVGTGTFWRGMERFVRTADVDTTTALIQAGYSAINLSGVAESAP